MPSKKKLRRKIKMFKIECAILQQWAERSHLKPCETPGCREEDPQHLHLDPVTAARWREMVA